MEMPVSTKRNHHFDKYIQAYTNEDPSIYRVQAL